MTEQDIRPGASIDRHSRRRLALGGVFLAPSASSRLSQKVQDELRASARLRVSKFRGGAKASSATFLSQESPHAA